MAIKHVEERIGHLARKAGPQVTELAGFLSGQFHHRVTLIAVALGFSAAEADEIASTSAAGAMKSFASACQDQRFARQFRKAKG